MAFCSNCGAQLNPNARFCANCGAPAPMAAENSDVIVCPQLQESEETVGVRNEIPDNQVIPVQQYDGQAFVMPYGDGAPTTAEASPKKKKTGLVIGTIAGVVAALGIAAAAMWLCGVFKPGYEKALDKYMKGLNGKDTSVMLDAVPPFYIDYLEEEGDGKTAARENLDGIIDGYAEEYGDDYHVTYEITEVEEFSKREIRNLEDDFESRYDIKVDIEEAVKLYLDSRFEDDDDSDSEESEMVCIKVDGKWYVNDEKVIKNCYDRIIGKYIEALENTDAEAVVEVVAPYYNDFLCEAWDCEIDEVIDDTAENIEDEYDYYAYYYGDNFDLSYEIIDTYEYSRSEIDEFIDDEWYYYDYYDVEIEEATMVTAELTINGTEGTDSEEWEFFCVKVDGEWYIDPSIGDFIW